MEEFGKKCKIERNDVLGRYVVAACDIRAGETILVESPVLIMPSGSETRCANCFRLADKLCSTCSVFSLCGDCKQHSEYDCNLLSGMRNLRVDHLRRYNEIYGILRCLLLRENVETADFYAELIQLEPHQEERRQTDIWLEHKKKIIDPILESRLIDQLRHCEEGELDEEMLQKICGIIDVNSFEIRAPDVDSLRAVYLRGSLLAHHCVANTAIAIDDRYQMKIYANREIRQGEMLHYCYTNPLLGTDERRQLLQMGKYFHCTCERCEDPTELGSHMSSLLCKSCLGNGSNQGFIVKDKEQEKWKCQQCSHSMDSGIVTRLLDTAKEEIFLAKNDVRRYELLIVKLSQIFHRNHYLLVDIKQNVAAILRAIIMSRSHRPGRQVYERKVRLCGEILEVLRIVQPGISRLTAIALYELFNSFADLSRLRFGENEIDGAKLLELLHEAESILRESLGMLIYEPVETPEGQLTKSMLKELKDLQNDITIVKAQIKSGI